MELPCQEWTCGDGWAEHSRRSGTPRSTRMPASGSVTRICPGSPESVELFTSGKHTVSPTACSTFDASPISTMRLRNRSPILPKGLPACEGVEPFTARPRPRAREAGLPRGLGTSVNPGLAGRLHRSPPLPSDLPSTRAFARVGALPFLTSLRPSRAVPVVGLRPLLDPLGRLAPPCAAQVHRPRHLVDARPACGHDRRQLASPCHLEQIAQ